MEGGYSLNQPPAGFRSVIFPPFFFLFSSTLSNLVRNSKGYAFLPDRVKSRSELSTLPWPFAASKTKTKKLFSTKQEKSKIKCTPTANGTTSTNPEVLAVVVVPLISIDCLEIGNQKRKKRKKKKKKGSRAKTVGKWGVVLFTVFFPNSNMESLPTPI